MLEEAEEHRHEVVLLREQLARVGQERCESSAQHASVAERAQPNELFNESASLRAQLVTLDQELREQLDLATLAQGEKSGLLDRVGELLDECAKVRGQLAVCESERFAFAQSQERSAFAQAHTHFAIAQSQERRDGDSRSDLSDQIHKRGDVVASKFEHFEIEGPLSTSPAPNPPDRCQDRCYQKCCVM